MCIPSAERRRKFGLRVGGSTHPGKGRWARGTGVAVGHRGSRTRMQRRAPGQSGHGAPVWLPHLSTRRAHAVASGPSTLSTTTRWKNTTGSSVPEVLPEFTALKSRTWERSPSVPTISNDIGVAPSRGVMTCHPARGGMSSIVGGSADDEVAADGDAGSAAYVGMHVML
jgi:hypothetical protein